MSAKRKCIMRILCRFVCAWFANGLLFLLFDAAILAIIVLTLFAADQYKISLTGGPGIHRGCFLLIRSWLLYAIILLLGVVPINETTAIQISIARLKPPTLHHPNSPRVRPDFQWLEYHQHSLPLIRDPSIEYVE